MAKLRTETISFDDITERGVFKIKFDINVNKDGTFTTTLPEDIVKILESANIDLYRNQLKKKGYFTHSTCDGLIESIKNVGLEYMSREMTEEKIVLHYCIQTRVSYAFDKDGNIIPNPGSDWSGVPDKFENHSTNRFANWINGNVNISACNNSPFGFLVYVSPSVKRVYKYRSGKIKIEYSAMHNGGEIAEKALEEGYFLNWLKNVPCISMPKDGEMKEMDYSENVCKFFVDMIKSIAMMNEKMKDFLEPEAIQLLADSNKRLM